MKSFHSYSSSFLFSKLVTRRFGYTEAREGVKENDNQLVVDVLTQLQVSVRCGVFNSLMLVLEKRFEIGYQDVGQGEGVKSRTCASTWSTCWTAWTRATRA